MAHSALASLINARNLSGLELVSHFTEGFRVDALHYVTANNSQPIDDGIKALPMGKAQIKGTQNKAIGEAIAIGMKVIRSTLPDGCGWIGAVHGAFSKAGKEQRTPYLAAHTEGVEAFRGALKASGAFPEKVAKTAEERAAAKKEKEEKEAKTAAETLAAARAALIASGEFVEASAGMPISAMATSALIDELITRAAETISTESLGILTGYVEALNLTRVRAAGLV